MNVNINVQWDEDEYVWHVSMIDLDADTEETQKIKPDEDATPEEMMNDILDEIELWMKTGG